MTIERIQKDSIAFYGENMALRDITEARADELRTQYLTRDLAAATVARRLKSCRSPKCGQNVNPKERKHYITPDDKNAAKPFKQGRLPRSDAS